MQELVFTESEWIAAFVLYAIAVIPALTLVVEAVKGEVMSTDILAVLTASFIGPVEALFVLFGPAKLQAMVEFDLAHHVAGAQLRYPVLAILAVAAVIALLVMFRRTLEEGRAKKPELYTDSDYMQYLDETFGRY